MNPGDDARRRRAERREAILLGTGCAMCGTWIVGLLVQVAFPSHPLPVEAHGVILVLIPLMFGGAYLSGRKADGA